MSSRVLLADGSEGTLIYWESYSSMICVNENVWALRSCGEFVDIRDAHSGSLMETLRLPEVCTQLHRILDRVWFLSASGRIVIYELNGLLLSFFDSQVCPIHSIHTFDGCPSFLATSQEGAFQVWNVESSEVQRTFYCESIKVVAIFPMESLVLSVQEDRISLWGPETPLPLSVLALDSVVAAVFIVKVADRSTECSNYFCWVGGNKWITVFRLSQNKPIFIQKERLIPCAKVQQLLSIASASRVVSLDAEYLVTVWDVRSYSPIRLFKIDRAMSVERGGALPLVFLAGSMRVSTVWTICGNSCLTWEDRELRESFSDDEAKTYPHIITHEELQLAQKKNACLLDMIEAYRCKVLEAISSTSGDCTRASATIMALDKCFRDQIEVLKRDDTDYHLASMAKTAPLDASRYWRERYVLERERNAILLKDLRLVSDHFTNSEPQIQCDIKVANLIKAYAASQERESDLQCRLLYMESQIHALNIDEVLPHLNNNPKHDTCEDTDKQHLRARITELEEELQEFISSTEEAVQVQCKVQNLLEALRWTESNLEATQKRALALNDSLALAESKNEKLLDAVENLTQRLRNMEEECVKYTTQIKEEQKASLEERKMYTLKFSEMEGEVQVLREKFRNSNELLHEASLASVRKEEISGLKEQIDFLKGIITLKQNESFSTHNAYDSIASMIESVKNDSPLVRLRKALENMDIRLEHLEYTEKILREKDDLIAVREDELRTADDSLKSLQKRMFQVSSLFSHIPYSANNVEALVLELNEYRQRYGIHEDINEAVELQLLELTSNRHYDEVHTNEGMHMNL